MKLAGSLRRSRSLMVAALLLAGCGGSSRTGTHQRGTRTTATPPSVPAPSELLSVPAVGRIYGHCKPGDRRWTLEFVSAPQAATDSITYRIGSGRPRTVSTGPGGKPLIWRLVPGRFTSQEPADPVSKFPATTIKTTEPISIDISQGSEPHIYRVKIRLTVAAAIGDASNCALISSTLNATTYYPGGQPPS